MPKASKLKVVKLNVPGAVRYDCPDGIVTIYGDRGKPLTYERINWLLDMAKERVRGLRD